MARPEVTGRAPGETEHALPVAQSCAPPPGASLTIVQFCAAEQISRSKYYDFRKKGLGPDETRVEGVIRITPASHQAWRRRYTKRVSPRSTGAVCPQQTTHTQQTKLGQPLESAGAPARNSDRQNRSGPPPHPRQGKGAGRTELQELSNARHNAPSPDRQSSRR
jgi:hypothetical protein